MKSQSDFKNWHRRPKTPTSVLVSFKECCKNHAANLGGFALDGCGEFMPFPSATQADPASLNCAACGCHRNFHRQEPYFQAQELIRIPPSQSPPSSPIPTSYYASAPHMLIALKSIITTTMPDEMLSNGKRPDSDRDQDPVRRRRKRCRTKLKQEQKEKMVLFAEKIEWKLHKVEEKVVNEFCKEVGVERGVLKVWMQNNKRIFGKKEVIAVDERTKIVENSKEE